MLPVIPVSSHLLKNPLMKKPIQYKAYVNGQESILVQNKDMSEADKLNAVRQVLSECVDGVDVDTLPFAVVEHLFVNIRAASAGETMAVRYRCANEVIDEDGGVEQCNSPIEFDIDLRKVEFIVPEEMKMVITLDEDTEIGVKMKQPSILTYMNLDEDASFKDMVVECIDCIFQGDQVFPAEEYKGDQLLAWWNTLTSKNQMKVVDGFFAHLPHIRHTHQHTCAKCGHEHKFEYTKLKHFFS